MQLDVKALGIELGALVAETIAPLQKRIAELEAREPTKGEKGDSGADGKDGRDGKDAVIAPEAIADAVHAYLEANPPAAGRDGKDGVNGKDGADGLNGKDGAPGKDGADGKDGVDGKDAEVTQEALQKAVAAHLAAYPIPAGRDGRDGIQGPQGEHGKDGVDGINGKDGKDGMSGKDGADGLSIEDFDIVVSDDSRSLTVKLSNGAKVVEKTIDLPFVLDRGVYDKTGNYRAGDGVTRQGSFWIARRDNPGDPATPDSGWRLAVKKGRDGKDGKDGPRGLQGKDGRPGRDLTQIGPDGAKW